MSNNSLEVKKENIFSKIANFFKNLFGSKKQENLVSENVVKEETKERKESDFLESIRINKEEKDDPELLRIQEQLEKNEISVFSISDDALHDIKEICDRQVSNLAKELDNKKTELNYLKFKLNNSQTNM